TTPCSPAASTPTCGGVTPTPATLTSWPPSAANALASAADDNSAGAAPAPRRRDPTRRFMAAALVSISTLPAFGGHRHRVGHERCKVRRTRRGTQYERSNPLLAHRRLDRRHDRILRGRRR